MTRRVKYIYNILPNCTLLTVRCSVWIDEVTNGRVHPFSGISHAGLPGGRVEYCQIDLFTLDLETVERRGEETADIVYTWRGQHRNRERR